MKDNIILYKNYKKIGLKNRTITEGKEIELVREYIDYRTNNFKPNSDNKMAVFLEPKIGDSYPDVVFVEYNPHNYEDWNDCRNSLELKDLKILYHIYSKRGINIENIVSQLGVSWKTTGTSIELLYDSGLITRKDGMWCVVDENKLVTNRIQAVEAKIGKWEEVLQQSIINKAFASESCALLCMKNQPQKEVVSRFGACGVGLLYKCEGSFKTLKRAKKRQMPSNFNSLLLNEWIGRIITMEKENL